MKAEGLLIDVIAAEYLASNIHKFVEVLRDEDNGYWAEEHFLKNLPDKFEFSIMARSTSDQLLGYIIASRKCDSCYIHKYMTVSQYRSMGIGKALFEQLCIIARQNSVQNIDLCVAENNKRAINFYLELGFLEYEKRKDSVNNNKLLKLKLKL